MGRFLLLLFLLAGCAAASPAASVEALGRESPAPLVQGTPALPSLIAGRVAVIDLWATWCDPCKKAIPKLVRLQKAFGPRGLVVAGVGVGEAPELVERFAAEAEISYPLYVDPEFRFADSVAASKVPTILILDRSGRIVSRSAELDKPALELLRRLLGEEQSARR